MDCDQLYTDFNVGAARQICLGSEARSRAEHELELKEKLNAKYVARGKLLEKKDSEILRLKSQLAEKEVEPAEVVRLCDQVSSLSGEKSALTAEVSALAFPAERDHLRGCLICVFLIWTSSDLPHCLHSLNIHQFPGTTCPYDDALLVAPRFPFRGNSGGSRQIMQMHFTLATGVGLRERLFSCLLFGSVLAVGVLDSE
ncbi:hypothetical protein Tco_1445092 [Tanacetum coccineum]